jgi:glycerol-3-phosphate dehydrogenase
VEVTGAFRESERIAGVRVRDRLTGDEAAVKARVTVNASGPWFERVAGAIGGAATDRIRTTKGVHLVCPPMTDRAMVLFSRVDGRLMFAIPRLGHTWLGTTDTDYSGDPGEAVATREDAEYVIESLRGAFPALTLNDVLYTTAGVRALVMQPGSASSVSRLHRIVDGAAFGLPGLVSILGAKITGYRAIAEDATDAVCRHLGVARRASTAEEALPGGRDGGRGGEAAWPHLYDLYGSRAAQVAKLAADDAALARPLSSKYPDIAAQVAFAAREEYCVTVADFVRRRSLLGATADQGWDAAPAVAAILAHELGWTADRQQRELEAYARDIDKTLLFRGADYSGARRMGSVGH